MASDNLIKTKNIPSSVIYVVRELSIDDASEYKRIHLEALKSHPNAFAGSHEEFDEKSPEDIRTEITGLKRTGGFVVGAFSAEGNN